jgi:hypothetical protein
VRVSVRTGPVRWSGPWALIGWLIARVLTGVGIGCYLAASHPRTAAALLALCGATWAVLEHPVATHLAVLAVLEALDAWALFAPRSWRRHGRPRLRAWWRSLWVYRRRWRTAMHVAELVQVVGGEVRLPQLRRVRCTDTSDVVQVRGLLGQRFVTWEDAGPMLAHVLGASGVEVLRGDDRRLTLVLERGRRGRSWNREPVTYPPPLESERRPVARRELERPPVHELGGVPVPISREVGGERGQRASLRGR